MEVVLRVLHLLPPLWLVTSCWQPAIGHGKSTYATEIGKCYPSGLDSCFLLCVASPDLKVMEKMLTVQIAFISVISEEYYGF